MIHYTQTYGFDAVTEDDYETYLSAKPSLKKPKYTVVPMVDEEGNPYNAYLEV